MPSGKWPTRSVTRTNSDIFLESAVAILSAESDSSSGISGLNRKREKKSRYRVARPVSRRMR